MRVIMNHRISMTVMLAGLITAACTTEQEQSMPVTSKSPSGVSTTTPSVSAETRNRALVRFIQAVPEVDSADVFADDMLVFTNISYQTVTAYREVPDNRLTFRLRPSGQYMAEPMAEESQGLSAGKHYTIVAVRDEKSAKADIRVLEDELIPPTPGKTKVRWINATPDLEEIDVYAPGTEKPLFSGLNFKGHTDYAEVSPMSGPLQIHRAGEKTPVFTISKADCQPGGLYTIVITGHATGTPPLRAIVVEDRFGSSTSS
jgi:hypothetical protein